MLGKRKRRYGSPNQQNNARRVLDLRNKGRRPSRQETLDSAEEARPPRKKREKKQETKKERLARVRKPQAEQIKRVLN